MHLQFDHFFSVGPLSLSHTHMHLGGVVFFCPLFDGLFQKCAVFWTRFESEKMVDDYCFNKE